MNDALCKKLSESAAKTVSFFALQLEETGSYKGGITDLCCYYKSPMMFITAERSDLAISILKYIQDTFLTTAGDFKTTTNLKSAKTEYAEYWSYINGWILRAAQKCNLNTLSEPAYQYLTRFNAGANQGFLTNDILSKNESTDILSTAHHGLIYLERNNLIEAKSAGNYLCTAIEKQPHLKKTFYLRFKNEKPITDFSKQQSAFFQISKTEPNQLYFMIGYPSAYLALLYKKTGDEKYLKAAKTYLDYAGHCNDSIWACPFSHKLAWAASILYEITKEKKYLQMVSRLTHYFLNQQNEFGMWFLPDINTAYDQSAEIAYWFLEIKKNLQG